MSAAVRSTGPPMPSGRFSLGGTATSESLALLAVVIGIEPVTSLVVVGDAGAGGIAA